MIISRDALQCHYAKMNAYPSRPWKPLKQHTNPNTTCIITSAQELQIMFIKTFQNKKAVDNKSCTKIYF